MISSMSASSGSRAIVFRASCLTACIMMPHCVWEMESPAGDKENGTLWYPAWLVDRAGRDGHGVCKTQHAAQYSGQGLHWTRRYGCLICVVMVDGKPGRGRIAPVYKHQKSSCFQSIPTDNSFQESRYPVRLGS